MANKKNRKRNNRHRQSSGQEAGAPKPSGESRGGVIYL